MTESAIASTSSLFRELTAQEQQSLDEMKALAEQASQRPDTKATERLIIAKRIIAERCVYGVDKNPLAVEMVKLSL